MLLPVPGNGATKPKSRIAAKVFILVKMGNNMVRALVLGDPPNSTALIETDGHGAV